jgi:hypothetical protein
LEEVQEMIAKKHPKGCVKALLKKATTAKETGSKKAAVKRNNTSQ